MVRNRLFPAENFSLVLRRTADGLQCPQRSNVTYLLEEGVTSVYDVAGEVYAISHSTDLSEGSDQSSVRRTHCFLVCVFCVPRLIERGVACGTEGMKASIV